MKILIVDDDEVLRAHLAEALEACAFDVLEAQSGDAALYLYQKKAPWEFVLSDYRFFPGMKIKDGVELVTAIQGINPFQQMAMMTSDTQGARRNLPRDLRHLPILRKPFRFEEVLRLLRDNLDLQGLAFILHGPNHESRKRLSQLLVAFYKCCAVEVFDKMILKLCRKPLGNQRVFLNDHVTIIGPSSFTEYGVVDVSVLLLHLEDACLERKGVQVFLLRFRLVRLCRSEDRDEYYDGG
jgi:CheY-like chemotaxis protein